MLLVRSLADSSSKPARSCWPWKRIIEEEKKRKKQRRGEGWGGKEGKQQRQLTSGRRRMEEKERKGEGSRKEGTTEPCPAAVEASERAMRLRHSTE